MKSLHARQIMSPDVVTLPPSASLRAAAAALAGNHITGAAVVTETGKLIGVLSESDLVEHDAQPRAKLPGLPEQDNSTVADVFSPYLVTAGPNTPVEDLAAMMVKHRVHRLFIVEDERLMGVVSSMDVMRAVSMVKASPKKIVTKAKGR